MPRFRPFRMIALLLAAALATAAANGATLDLTADAVLGQADMVSHVHNATATGLKGPTSIAEDPVTGELWVCDTSHHRVLRYSSAAGFANGQAANLVLGQPDFTAASPNRGSSPSANTLNHPEGIAVDQGGRLYVADSANHRLLLYRPPFANGMDASLVVGQPDFTGNAPNRGGAPAANSFSTPRGVAVSNFGHLFVADTGNNRVIMFPAPIATGASATRVFGQAGFTSAVDSQTGASGMSLPVGLAIERDTVLWVAAFPRVLRYGLGATTTGTTTADAALCQPDLNSNLAGTEPNRCLQPTGIAVDASGTIYVSDIARQRITVFPNPVMGASATSVIGQADFTQTACNRNGGAIPTASSVCNPQGLAIDRKGNLLVADADNHRVLRFDIPRARGAPVLTGLSPSIVPRGGAGFVLTVQGTGFRGDSVVSWNGLPRQTQYLSAQRLVAQIGAPDITGAGPFVVTVNTPAPGGGSSGALTVLAKSANALDPLADRVLGQSAFNIETVFSPDVGEEQAGLANAANFGQNGVQQIAIDRNSGRLFVSDSQANRILSWPSATDFGNGQAADLVLGQPDEFTNTCNSAGVGPNTLCLPIGMAVDPSGGLYVADTGNNRVLRYAPPLTSGMAATRVYGQFGSFTSRAANLGGVSASSLNAPAAVAVNETFVFIYDTLNSRIVIFDAASGTTVADRVIGQPNLTSASTLTVGFTSVGAGLGSLALDSAGRLFYSDSPANRILRYSPPFLPPQGFTQMLAEVIIGQASPFASAPGTSETRLRTPVGLAFDPADNLLVVDRENHRVLRYTAPLTSGMAASDVLGSLDFAVATPGISDILLDTPSGIAVDGTGNVYVGDTRNQRVLAFRRPFAFAIDPAGDLDRDGIPNAVEAAEGRDPYTKDNDVFANARLFAMQQYRDFLAREGDTVGLTYWTNLVQSGTQTRAQAIQGFFTSPEFQGVIAPVARLYFAYFLRFPDYAGLQFHVARSRTGTPLATISNDFAASPEFVSRYGALDNDAFIELVYNNVLGRPSDPVGKAYWLAQLAGGATRGFVMTGFSESPEFIAASDDRVFVTMMYVGMLSRAPDTVGFDYWVAQLDGGTSGLDMTNGFLAAPEYHARFLP